MTVFYDRISLCFSLCLDVFTIVHNIALAVLVYQLFSFSFQCNVVCYIYVYRFILQAMVLSVLGLNDFFLPLWYLLIPLITL